MRLTDAISARSISQSALRGLIVTLGFSQTVFPRFGRTMINPLYPELYSIPFFPYYLNRYYKSLSGGYLFPPPCRIGRYGAAQAPMTISFIPTPLSEILAAVYPLSFWTPILIDSEMKFELNISFFRTTHYRLIESSIIPTTPRLFDVSNWQRSLYRCPNYDIFNAPNSHHFRR